MTTTRPALRLLAAAALASCLSATAHAQQTFFNLAAGNYSQDFSSIGAWSNSYAGGTGAENWRVATSVASSLVTNVNVFTTATSGGVQRGTNSMVFLATGANTGGTDLLLNFSGRTSGIMSFNWSKIANTPNETNARSSDLKVQYSTDNGTNFTDITNYAIPRINNNSTPESGSLNFSLPSALSGQPQAVLRFFFWNNGQVGGAGNRPKWNIDDVLITSSGAATAPVVTSFSPATGAAGTSVTIGGSNFTGATNVSFNGVAATFLFNSDTSITASVPVGALSGPISVASTNGTGLSSSNFLVPTLSVILPATINEGDTSFGEVTLNETNASDINVTVTSSSTNDLVIDPAPIVIFAGLTNAFFNFTAPLDSTIDGDTNVTVTPSAAGFASIPDTITVVNVDAVKIPLTSFSTNSYIQNFDSLGTTTVSNVVSLTSGVQTSLGTAISTNLNGWFAAKIAGSAGIPNVVADNGSSSSGAVYNYGTTGATNRSLGGLASGSLTPAFGALVVNNTGSTINSIILNLTGKFWRPSAANTNSLNFAFGVVDGVSVNNNNFLTTASATNLSLANIVGPVVATTNDQTPLDGNLATNQVLISNVVIPVSLAPGETMFFRWQDFDNVNADAGLAIDDLSLTASTNLAAPSVAAVTVNPFALAQDQAQIASSVVSEGGSTLTARGFVYSESFFNTNPVIGGPNTTAITNTPAEVGAFTNTITGLLASTAYTVRSFAINAQGTNYSVGTTFNTLAPNPAFSGVYTQSFDGLTNTFFPNGWRCLSTSNVNNYAGDWNSTNAVAVGFYGRTNIPGILGYLHGNATGILSNRLTLVNNTGGTLTNLWVSYTGEVNVLNPTSNTRFPEWTVVVDGQTNSALFYSTAGGVSSNLVAEITGLSITNGGNIIISWSSDRGAGTGSSRMIGMTDVRVATNAPPIGTPTINVSGSLTNFTTTVGTASASQSFTASGTNLVGDIEVSTPAFYQVSVDNTNFSGALNLAPSGGVVTNTLLYVRLAANAPVGSPAGNVLLGSTNAAIQTVPVTGTVFSTYTAWLNGAPTNNANLLKYAIGGASSPTATDGTAPATAVTSSNLSITAIVRTNDPALDVIGEGLTNLSVGPWSTNGVTQTVSTNQAGVPTGTERQIFSIPRGTNTSQFLRLDSILQP